MEYVCKGCGKKVDDKVALIRNSGSKLVCPDCNTTLTEEKDYSIWVELPIKNSKLKPLTDKAYDGKIEDLSKEDLILLVYYFKTKCKNLIDRCG